MRTRDHARPYGVVDAALVRATVHCGPLPELWPELADEQRVESWRDWLAAVWAVPSVAEAVTVASPVLAARVDQLRTGRRPRPAQVRGMVMSLARYLVRMRGRATPFGVFAGVAPLRFGTDISLRLPGACVVRARADAQWLAEVIYRLESCSEVRRRLAVVANDLVAVRGERVVVGWAPHACQPGPGGSAHVSVRRSRVVELVLRTARLPIRVCDLIEKLAAELSQVRVERLDAMLAELMAHGALISDLRPPSTSVDALAHVVSCIERIDARAIEEVAALVEQLCRIHTELGAGRAERILGQQPRRRMRALTTVVEQPMMVDCRFASTMVLPAQVADEIAAAAHALVRAAPHPAGEPHLRDYHARFVDRYGTDALVSVDDLIDATSGLGFPAHYDQDNDRAGLDLRLSPRDERLLVLAQQAALDQARQVELSEQFLDLLAAHAASPVRPAPHLEVCAEVLSPTAEALTRGEFTAVVRGTGRSALAMSGRSVSLLPARDQQRMIDQYRRLPTTTEGALPAQLSFPPRHRAMENVTRTSRLLDMVLGLAEHHVPERGLLCVHDLAVTADPQRLHVVSLSKRRVVEPVVVNAAAGRTWPPLARLLVEIARSGTAAVSPFAWGAASRLPFVPRVCYGRSVLVPARWRIPAGVLPAPGTRQGIWNEALRRLRDRLGLPPWVSVGEHDRRLRLNLDEPMDLGLLRDFVDRAATTGQSAMIEEAPAPAEYGWFGGRVHEIVVPLAASTPPTPAILTQWTPSALIGRDAAVLPGQGVLFAQLFGHADHVDTILVNHLARLLAELRQAGEEPMWWYIRYRDPQPHLRLRLHPHRDGYGQAVVALGAWAGELRRHGLVGDLRLDTYRPEISRYGCGPAMDAAEALFAADSVAARAQVRALAVERQVSCRALTAASMVDLATSVAGGRSQGMRWLLGRRPRQPAGALVREEVRQAVEFADPSDDHAALRAVVGGAQIVEAWQARRRAAATYVGRLERSPAAPSPESVLGSLLHLHHVRAIGIDLEGERITDRIARAVVLAWSARLTNQAGTR